VNVLGNSPYLSDPMSSKGWTPFGTGGPPPLPGPRTVGTPAYRQAAAVGGEGPDLRRVARDIPDMKAQVARDRAAAQVERAGRIGAPGEGFLGRDPYVTTSGKTRTSPVSVRGRKMGGGGGSSVVAAAASSAGGGGGGGGRWAGGVNRVRGAISSNILRAGQWAGGKAGNLGPGIRGAAWSMAKTPLRSAGIAGAAMYGAGRVAFGNGTVTGTAGYGIAGGLMGAAGGAAWANRLNAAKTIGGMGVARGAISSNTGAMARKMGARGAAAGLLIGALLSGNSASNGFRGLHR